MAVVASDYRINVDESVIKRKLGMQDKEIAAIKRKENLIYLGYFIVYWFFFYPFIVGVIKLFGMGSFFFYIFTFSYVVISIIIAIKLRKK